MTTDVNRDKLWAVLEPTGWRPVRQIALDETTDEVGQSHAPAPEHRGGRGIGRIT